MTTHRGTSAAPRERRPLPQQERDAWKARELASAPPLTQQQLADLRRLLLPQAPPSTERRAAS